MRILVTGGAGFIGSHVCERLLASEHSLVVIDDLNNFYEPATKRAHLEDIGHHGRFEFVEADINDEAMVEDVFSGQRPDAVIHLAARAGVRPSLEDPLLYERVNVRGTLVLLEAARRHRVAKFLFASSSSVYGASAATPFREDADFLCPVSVYAATKLAGEQFCRTYSHLHGVNCICLRFFTVYGPRQRPDLAIRKFMEAMRKGQAIPFFGKGTSARDYTYIDDIVSGIMAALHYDTEYDTFNLGNSHPVTLSELVSALERVLGVPASLDPRPIQAGDVPITYADISKAQTYLGYQPRTALDEGLRHMAHWLFHCKRSDGVSARHSS